MKKKDLIRIACKNILFAIWIVIINLVMNETMTVCIVETVLVVGISLIFDIIQLRNKTQWYFGNLLLWGRFLLLFQIEIALEKYVYVIPAYNKYLISQSHQLNWKVLIFL